MAAAVQWVVSPGWIGTGQGHDPIDDRLGQRRDARRPGLVAQQALDPGLHEALLPAPDHGLALAGLLHDRRRPEAIGGEQHDPAAPGMLLRAIALRCHRCQADAVGGVDCDDDPLTHSQDSHAGWSVGILKGTRSSGWIH
jgi:hypothetical protein